jgi:hypothetical protein
VEWQEKEKRNSILLASNQCFTLFESFQSILLISSTNSPNAAKTGRPKLSGRPFFLADIAQHI